MKKIRSFLPEEEVWRGVVEGAVAGRATKRLAPTEEFLHAFVYAHLVDNAYFASTVSLRRLLELALLARRHQDRIDCERIAHVFRSEKYLPVLKEGIEELVQLFGIARPAVFNAPRRDPLRALRRRIEGRFGPYEIYRVTRRKIAEDPSRLLNLIRPGSWQTYFQAMAKNRKGDRSIGVNGRTSP